MDDEALVREVVAEYLAREGFAVQTAANGETARRFLSEFQPDLVVLDLMLPAISGFDILQEIRRSSDLPVIVLTARADEADRVSGLEMGADDYVVKPFSPRELVARVRSVIRRSAIRTTSAQIRFDELDIDPRRRAVLIGGVPIELTAKEFDLVLYLASNPSQVFSRNQLLEQVWGSSADWQDPATVTVHVRRIRQKLENDPSDPRWLKTVWGVGYRFEP